MSVDQIRTSSELPPPEVKEVADRIFCYLQADGSWGLNNAGFVVGRRGATVIDTCFTERRTRSFIDAIREVTKLPLQTLINTHHHGDHTHGNYLFPDSIIVAHELCREAILEAGLPKPDNPIGMLFPNVDWGNLELAAPTLTYQDNMTLYIEDLRLELIFMGPAHTTNDTVVWLPDLKLLFSGDLIFNEGTPFVVMGSVAGSLEAVERLRALGPETIVPGHGPVCGPELFDPTEAYLKFVQDAAWEGYKLGMKPLETARSADLVEFAEWHDSERLVGNIYRAFSEFEDEERGIKLNMKPIISDMEDYNGGSPLRCLA